MLNHDLRNLLTKAFNSKSVLVMHVNMQIIEHESGDCPENVFTTVGQTGKDLHSLHVPTFWTAAIMQQEPEKEIVSYRQFREKIKTENTDFYGVQPHDNDRVLLKSFAPISQNLRFDGYFKDVYTGRSPVVLLDGVPAKLDIQEMGNHLLQINKKAHVIIPLDGTNIQGTPEEFLNKYFPQKYHRRIRIVEKSKDVTDHLYEIAGLTPS